MKHSGILQANTPAKKPEMNDETPSASTQTTSSSDTTDEAAATPSTPAKPSASNIVDGLIGSAAVQKAVVEKGIEVAGKMVDKQLQIIDEAQDKAAAFLDKGVRFLGLRSVLQS